ncbi:MAG: hypothetical protein R3E42_09530 [Burkholderiaceae bacterium]
MVWREKIDDYSAGYSYTAAPLIAEGLLLTGVSGGEFGVVGRGKRDPKTGKMVWTRPVVEGHMGYKTARKTASPQHHQRQLAWRDLEDRRRGQPAGRFLRCQDRSGLFRYRQPGSLEQPRAQGRQPVFRPRPWPSM